MRPASRRALVGLLLAAGCTEGPRQALPPPPPPAPGAATKAPPPAPPDPSRDAVPAPSPATVPAAPWEGEPDPRQARSIRERENLRLDPAFIDLRLSLLEAPPFLVAEVEGPGESRAAFVAEEALALRRDFLALLAEAGIVLPPEPADGGVRLRWILFPDGESFRDWHRRNGLALPSPESTGYFSRGGAPSARLSREGISSVGVRGLAFHAMLAATRRALVQGEDDALAAGAGEPPESVPWEDARLRGTMAWFERGLSLALASPAEGRPGPPSAEAFEGLRKAKAAGRLWALEEFLFADAVQTASRAKVKSGATGAAHPEQVHLAQSWLLVDVLLRDPRWRDGFLALLRRECAGKSGRPYFLEAFGLPRGLPGAHGKGVDAWIAAVEEACLARIETGR